jgi:hypothetical protein
MRAQCASVPLGILFCHPSVGSSQVSSHLRSNGVECTITRRPPTSPLSMAIAGKACLLPFRLRCLRYFAPLGFDHFCSLTLPRSSRMHARSPHAPLLFHWHARTHAHTRRTQISRSERIPRAHTAYCTPHTVHTPHTAHTTRSAHISHTAHTANRAHAAYCALVGLCSEPDESPYSNCILDDD